MKSARTPTGIHQNLTAPRVLTPAETAGVRDVLLGTVGPALPGDEETARVYAAVDDPAGLRLLPLSDYARTPLSL